MVCPDPARVTKMDIEVMVDPNATPSPPVTARRRVALIRR